MNALLCYMKAYCYSSIGPNGNLSGLPSILKPGFKFCHICHLNEPPRSHHCPVCNICILRRDHHCSFVACCVGHFNQRYFVAAIANLWILSFFFAIINWILLVAEFTVFDCLALLKILAPHLSMLMGAVTAYQCFMAFVFISSATTFFFVSYMLSAQAFCLYRGQTRVEYLLDIHCWNFGLLENLQQSLGVRWPLVFLSPVISSPLPSDGVSFRARETEMVSKYTNL